MKKLLLLVPAAILTFGAMATEDATAGEPTPIQRVQVINPAIYRLFTTNVHGIVDMTAARNGQYAGMTCDKLSVSATSVQMVQPTCGPGQFCPAYPKWVHSESKISNGTDANHCTYEILVPAGSAFSLGVGTQVNLCGGSGLTYVTLKSSPGQITVPTGGSKEADLSIATFTKECIN